MSASLHINETAASFHNKILQEIARLFNANFKRILKPLRSDIRGEVTNVFRLSDVYDAIINGPLDAILGLPQDEAARRVDEVIDTIGNNIDISLEVFKPSGSKIVGGIKIGVLMADFSDILSLPVASYGDAKGNYIPWLDWLLIKGDSIIIADYEVQFGPHPKSRSGSAIMVKNKNVGFKIPPEYSGTQGDNWLTRAIDDGSQLLDKAFTKAIEKNMGVALNVFS